MIGPPEDDYEAMMKIARTETAALILGVVVGIVLAACAAKPPQRAGSQPSRGSVPGETDAGSVTPWEGIGGAGRDDIDPLDDAIDQDLAQLGIDPPTDDEVISAVVAHDVPPLPMASQVATTCQMQPTGSACDDVCTLADSICANAGKICAISDDLGDDDYAIQHCAKGRMSCARATQRCCSC
jgi:hypothetical protein